VHRRSQSKKLAVAALTTQGSAVLQVAGLTKLLPTFPTVEEAAALSLSYAPKLFIAQQLARSSPEHQFRWCHRWGHLISAGTPPRATTDYCMNMRRGSSTSKPFPRFRFPNLTITTKAVS